MRRLMFVFVLFVCVCGGASAQTAKPAPTSEQSLQELVTEVRQLRATLQRMNAAVYKGQVMLERLKLQQEQVTRISKELTEVRETVQEVRMQLQRMKDMLGRAEPRVEGGAANADEVAGLKGELDLVSQREQRLSMRETQLAGELEAEKAKLNDLNNRLNALIELEMAPK